MSHADVQSTSTSTIVWRNAQMGCGSVAVISLIVGAILLGLSEGGVLPNATTDLRYGSIAAGVTAIILGLGAVYSGVRKRQALTLAPPRKEDDDKRKGPQARIEGAGAEGEGIEGARAEGEEVEAEGMEVNRAEGEEVEAEGIEVIRAEGEGVEGAGEVEAEEEGLAIDPIEDKKEALRGKEPSKALRVIADFGEAIGSGNPPRRGELVGVKRTGGRITYAIFLPTGSEYQRTPPTLKDESGKTFYFVLFEDVGPGHFNKKHVPLEDIQRYDQTQIHEMNVEDLVDEE